MDLLNAGLFTEGLADRVVLEQGVAEHGDGQVWADHVRRNFDKRAVPQQFDLVHTLDPMQAVEDRLIDRRA